MLYGTPSTVECSSWRISGRFRWPSLAESHRGTRPGRSLAADAVRRHHVGNENGAEILSPLCEQCARGRLRDGGLRCARPRRDSAGKLPRHVDTGSWYSGVLVGLGKNVSGCTRPRLSWGRSVL